MKSAGNASHAGRVLGKMREICLALPGTVEVAAWGHPNFKAGRKTFAALEEYKGQLCICFKTTLPDQEALLNDSRYFASPYTGHQGWVSMKAEGRPDWKAIRHHLVSSYRLVALKRMLELLDSRGARVV